MWAFVAKAEADDTTFEVAAGRLDVDAMELALDLALAKEAAYAEADAEAEDDAEDIGPAGREETTTEGTVWVPVNARECAGSRDSTKERRLSHFRVVHPSRLSDVSLGHIQV